jgi:hypothetical protein
MEITWRKSLTAADLAKKAQITAVFWIYFKQE